MNIVVISTTKYEAKKAVKELINKNKETMTIDQPEVMVTNENIYFLLDGKPSSYNDIETCDCVYITSSFMLSNDYNIVKDYIMSLEIAAKKQHIIL